MQNNRFLKNEDYHGIITEEAFLSITRGKLSDVINAENSAEITILEHLTEMYEIESEFNIGKAILDHDRRICYPIGAHVTINEEIYKVLRPINGFKAPTSKVYWRESSSTLTSSPRYSQFRTYYPGEVVMFNEKQYECVIENGYELNDIRIPGLNSWEMINVEEWCPMDYGLHAVVKRDNIFYTLFNMDGYEAFEIPESLTDNWGEIAVYDPEYNSYELSDHEYVVYDGEVFYPVMDVNADEISIGSNLVKNDPRHPNLKKHMTQIALFELCKKVAPKNVANTRIIDYENSIKWLQDCAKFRINPRISRKVDKNNEQVTDWQMAAFQTNFDPYRNPWLI